MEPTFAPPVADTVTADPTPPTQPDMDAIQRVIRDALEEHEARRRIELDTRDERLKTAIRDEIKDELKPIRDALAQRVTADEARRIAGEEISPIQDQMKALEQSVAKGFDSFREVLNGMSDSLSVIKGLPEKIANIEGQLSAYTAMRTTQDEQRQQAVARAETKADDALTTVESVRNEFTTRLSVMHNDLYGAPGGVTGAIAVAFQAKDAIAELRPSLDRFNGFLDRAERERDITRDTLAAHQRFIDAQIARQVKRDAMVAQMISTVGKLAAQGWFKVLVGTLLGLGAWALGLNHLVAPIIELFR